MNTWKKSNIVLVHKKSIKQIVNNYRPVSLLPICSKILEETIFDSIMRFLNKIKLLSDSKSGFRPFESCECSLLSVVHDIYKSFDYNPPLEVRGVSLDISKAFARVRHDGFIYKIKSFWISDTPLQLIKNFLSNRYQRVVLNVQSSSWVDVSVGVPQGSVLSPLFFLMYINDLSCGFSWTTKHFADDTSLFSVVHDVTQSTNELDDDLEKISNWVYQWKMSFNPDKSRQPQEIIFTCKTPKVVHPPAIFSNIPAVRSSCQRHLGIYFDEKLNFSNPVKEK